MWDGLPRLIVLLRCTEWKRLESPHPGGFFRALWSAQSANNTRLSPGCDCASIRGARTGCCAGHRLTLADARTVASFLNRGEWKVRLIALIGSLADPPEQEC
jgi:hypothetical protein